MNILTVWSFISLSLPAGKWLRNNSNFLLEHWHIMSTIFKTGFQSFMLWRDLIWTVCLHEIFFINMYLSLLLLLSGWRLHGRWNLTSHLSPSLRSCDLQTWEEHTLELSTVGERTTCCLSINYSFIWQCTMGNQYK